MSPTLNDHRVLYLKTGATEVRIFWWLAISNNAFYTATLQPNTSPPLWNNSVKRRPIWLMLRNRIIKISRERFWICPLHLRCYHCTLWNADLTHLIEVALLPTKSGCIINSQLFHPMKSTTKQLKVYTLCVDVQQVLRNNEIRYQNRSSTGWITVQVRFSTLCRFVYWAINVRDLVIPTNFAVAYICVYRMAPEQVEHIIIGPT